MVGKTVDAVEDVLDHGCRNHGPEWGLRDVAEERGPGR